MLYDLFNYPAITSKSLEIKVLNSSVTISKSRLRKTGFQLNQKLRIGIRLAILRNMDKIRQVSKQNYSKMNRLGCDSKC